MASELPATVLSAWHEGAEYFNEGRYWDAHEAWERGWKDLPEPRRTWVQAWIQVAAALHLEPWPERALAVQALRDAAAEKLRQTAAVAGGLIPRIEIFPDPAARAGLRAHVIAK